jgi:hypothetical protein
MREWTIVVAFIVLGCGFGLAVKKMNDVAYELGYCTQLLSPNVTAVPVE